MMPLDFLEQLDAMRERGELDEAQALNRGVPRELKRSWLALIDTLGQGAFGEVSAAARQRGFANVPFSCERTFLAVTKALGTYRHRGPAPLRTAGRGVPSLRK